VKSTATATRSTPGVIHAAESYRADEFRRRTGLNDFTWRAVRKAGLRVVRFGRKLWVRGSDWFEFLERAASGEFAEPDS
jgi:hypothetical protein